MAGNRVVYLRRRTLVQPGADVQRTLGLVGQKS